MPKAKVAMLKEIVIAIEVNTVVALSRLIGEVFTAWIECTLSS